MVRTASNAQEFLALKDEPDSSHVRSLDELKTLFKNPTGTKHTDGLPVNPFTALSENAKSEFLDNARFGNGGLAHAKYQAVREELNDEYFSAFWQAFGIDKSYFADIADHTCLGAGQCTPMAFITCTSYC